MAANNNNSHWYIDKKKQQMESTCRCTWLCCCRQPTRCCRLVTRPHALPSLSSALQVLLPRRLDWCTSMPMSPSCCRNCCWYFAVAYLWAYVCFCSLVCYSTNWVWRGLNSRALFYIISCCCCRGCSCYCQYHRIVCRRCVGERYQ